MGRSIARDEIKGVRAGGMKLQAMTDSERNGLLEGVKEALIKNKEAILSANRKDLDENPCLSSAVKHRVELTDDKFDAMASGLDAVINLPSPVMRVKERRELDEGLILEKVQFPLGVIGMVFEARPDAMVQIISLAIKSGNAIVLKGGKEAKHSNKAIFEAIKKELGDVPYILLLESREDVSVMLEAEGDVDLIIPRGSNSFVRYVMENTKIPVMGHADGICSVYVDKDADLEKAVRIVTDSKVQYPAACNAAETILVHEAVSEEFLPLLKESFDEHCVKIHADERAVAIIGGIAATEEDYDTEFLTLECVIKVVDSLDEAISHISKHSSHHTDAIVTEDREASEKFLRMVDSADVFSNCSTRFADGFRFGLGAEVGISTSKLHARGPVGLDGLMTTKWILRGSGQCVAEYSGKGAKKFTHKELTI